jgi:hypothetical protein
MTRVPRPAGDLDDFPLEPAARDLLRRVVQIVHRCGGSRAGIERAVLEEVRNLPSPHTEGAAIVEPEQPQAPEVMTAWYPDAPFVDGTGQPVPVKFRGPAPSFEALVCKVDRTLDAAVVLKYLIRAGSVRRHRGRYWAVNRVVILRDIAGPRDMRSLRGLEAMSRTAEHNLMPATDGPGWMERTAYNARIPVRTLPDFAIHFELHGMALLTNIDAWMHNAASEAREGEPTVELTVGVYHSQKEHEPFDLTTTNQTRSRTGRS